MKSKITTGYMLALESKGEDPVISAQELKLMVQSILWDHGYDVSVSIESMGEIDCYEEEG